MFRWFAQAGGSRRSRQATPHWWIRAVALAAGAGCGAVAAGVAWAAIGRYVGASPYFQFQRIEVHGDLPPEWTRALAELPVAPGTPLFHIDLAKWRDDLTQQYPAFHEITVIRKLPQTVVIEVQTRLPKARLAYGGQLLCVDAGGRVFPNVGHPRHRDLPLIAGLDPAVVELQVGEVAKGHHVTRALALLDALAASGLPHRFRLAQINAADYKNLAVQFAGWPEVFVGYEEFAERLKRFELLAPAIEPRREGVQYVDVRFADPIMKPK